MSLGLYLCSLLPVRQEVQDKNKREKYNAQDVLKEFLLLSTLWLKKKKNLLQKDNTVLLPDKIVNNKVLSS